MVEEKENNQHRVLQQNNNDFPTAAPVIWEFWDPRPAGPPQTTQYPTNDKSPTPAPSLNVVVVVEDPTPSPTLENIVFSKFVPTRTPSLNVRTNIPTSAPALNVVNTEPLLAPPTLAPNSDSPTPAPSSPIATPALNIVNAVDPSFAPTPAPTTTPWNDIIFGSRNTVAPTPAPFWRPTGTNDNNNIMIRTSAPTTTKIQINDSRQDSASTSEEKGSPSVGAITGGLVAAGGALAVGIFLVLRWRKRNASRSTITTKTTSRKNGQESTSQKSRPTTTTAASRFNEETEKDMTFSQFDQSSGDPGDDDIWRRSHFYKENKDETSKKNLQQHNIETIQES